MGPVSSQVLGGFASMFKSNTGACVGVCVRACVGALGWVCVLGEVTQFDQVFYLDHVR